MSKSLPYVPWYHGDFLRSTAGWTLVERAVYWMLLSTQWESGPLPNDMTRLAAIASTDISTVTSVWPVVGKKFITTAEGLINERVEEHRQNYQAFRQRQIDGGRKGGNTAADNRRKRLSNVVDFPASKELPRG